MAPLLAPLDQHNSTLVRNVHPVDWRPPTAAARYNLVVIGAGTAGLVTAAGGAGLGARVALVERDFLGGDCLNVGCVPSKCIIRSSRVFGEVGSAAALGVHVPPGVEADFGAVMERMRRLRARISDHDSVERFTRLGVDVFLGSARFVGPDAVEVDGTRLRFSKAVIATGTRAACPAIPGLAEAGFLTNETVFGLTERPRRLAVIGGGPIGCELAQAFRRLGSEVVLFHSGPHLLNREDPDAAGIVQQAFLREGVHLRAFAQKDPLVEYRGEGHVMFEELAQTIRTEVVFTLFHVTVELEEPGLEPMQAHDGALHYEHETSAGADVIAAAGGTATALATAPSGNGGSFAQAPAVN